MEPTASYRHNSSDNDFGWTLILTAIAVPAASRAFMAAADHSLLPLPYQDALADYLKAEEPETWAWFDSAEVKSEFAENLRLELLKQTFRLDATTYPELFAALHDAQVKLGVDSPVTIYQAQGNNQLNAAIYHLPGEAHIVLEGAVLQLLNPAELRAVLGHELAHHQLWGGTGRMLLADRILQTMAADPRAQPSHFESHRLMRLYTEIYADRGSLRVIGDPHVVISALVKLATGLTQVDPASYIRQAEEIFARSKVKTEGVSHPEAFIRARAVMLWAENAPNVEQEIVRMIEGDRSLDKLDLLGQQRMTAFTRRWLQLFLRPSWIRTDAVRGQARLFFPDFDFATEGHRDDALVEALRDASTSVRDYFCYLLLDFSAVDAELEMEPLKAAFILASELGWDERLEALAVKELKVKKREAQKLRAEARASVEKPDAVPTPEASA
jgi:Zn-dependent protease with chaperone function